MTTDPTLHDLLGDLEADEPNGILDRYETRAAPLNEHLVVTILCRRSHGDEGPTVMAILRDADGNQSGLTLAELVESALRHEADEHPEEGP